MKTIREYIYTTNRRVTLEWALIENENDTSEVTLRVRRGIDIDAGCGHLKAAVKKTQEEEAKTAAEAVDNSIKELKGFIGQEKN